MKYAHQEFLTVRPDGSLTLTNVPFSAGQQVEVIVLAPPPPEAATTTVSPDRARYPLQGTPYRFDDPFGPVVDPDDWNANR